MKRLIIYVLAVAALASVAGEIAMANDQSCPEFNLNFIGARKMLSDDWKPNNEQDELGATIDLRGANWPVSLELGYLYASKKGTADALIQQGNVTTAFNSLERESRTEEVSAGIRKNWPTSSGFTPFVSAGATWIKATLKYTDVTSFDESKVGWYGSAGIYYTLIKFLNVGVFARYSDSKITLGGTDLNAGGWHYGGLVGFHF